MDENKTPQDENPTQTSSSPTTDSTGKIKTRTGSGYLKQLYSTARTSAGATHSHLKSLTTFLVNFIPTEQVDISEYQVRSHFDDSEIEALSQSVRQHGVLQPILVVQEGDRYKVIAGERRLRASKLAGLERIPARILNTNDKAIHEIALRENLDRVDLHPIEEGEGYVSLLEAQVYTSHDSIAKAFGKPKSRITECVGFTKLPDETKTELLRLGIKNRSLLRQLQITPIDQHASMIREASGKEEEILLKNLPGTAVNSSKQAAPKEKDFKYQLDEKGLRVPGFRWKKKDGKAKLQAYLDTLLRLIDETEKAHAKS